MRVLVFFSRRPDCPKAKKQIEESAATQVSIRRVVMDPLGRFAELETFSFFLRFPLHIPLAFRDPGGHISCTEGVLGAHWLNCLQSFVGFLKKATVAKRFLASPVVWGPSSI